MRNQFRLLLLFASLIIIAAGCAGAASEQPDSPKGPALVMFYTDN